MTPQIYPLLGYDALVLNRIPDFIKDDMQLQILFYKGKPIDVQVPGTMSLKVVEANPADAGGGKDKMSKMVDVASIV